MTTHATADVVDPRFDGRVTPSEEDPRRCEALLPIRYQPDSHAANLVQLDNHDLLCAWFNGPGEGDPGTNVVLSRLPRGASRWTEPVVLAADPRRPEQNPVVAQDATGLVWLLHPSNEPHDQTTARVVVRTSTDRGRNWSEPRVLFEDPGIFVRSPPLMLSDGAWLLPAYYCRRGREHSVVKITTDQGHSWREYDLPDSDHRVQMSVVERDDQTLFAMFRSRDADRIYAAESADFGRTWTGVRATELPNNNSSIQVTKLHSQNLALVYNDATLERDQFRWVGTGAKLRKKPLRTPLTLALSCDGGRTWPYRRNLQTADLEYHDNELGYSYPSVVQTSDGGIHIAFSYLRKTIKHVRVDEAWVKEGDG